MRPLPPSSPRLEQDLQGYLRLVIDRVDVDELTVGSDEARPTDRMPILRLDEDGQLIPELRRWGFIMQVDGKTINKATGQPKKLAKAVINAMSEKLTSSYMWKWSFKERRCLIPMSSWDEWPETGAGKQRVRVSISSEPVFAAAGLYDSNVDPKTGEKVAVYTMCTVPPNEFLGTGSRSGADDAAAGAVRGVARWRSRCARARWNAP